MYLFFFLVISTSNEVLGLFTVFVITLSIACVCVCECTFHVSFFVYACVIGSTWDIRHTRNGPFPRVPSRSARLALAPQLLARSADEEKVWGDEADNEGTILLSRQIVCSGLSEVPASSTKLHAPSASGLGTSAGERKVFLPGVQVSALLPRADMLTLNVNILQNDYLFCLCVCFSFPLWL